MSFDLTPFYLFVVILWFLCWLTYIPKTKLPNLLVQTVDKVATVLEKVDVKEIEDPWLQPDLIEVPLVTEIVEVTHQPINLIDATKERQKIMQIAVRRLRKYCSSNKVVGYSTVLNQQGKAALANYLISLGITSDNIELTA